ncbi:hypothetical protein [Rubinisphaera italica]|uniref:Carboxypeptidase regulatory-like domain-containing protein n=1 Tax=Rubinisphaera italica TaxID=2527969 RepID=A0A5C5XKD7_9PLAN|nr:hypothetical protein [Rubinisphaera italica]TWT63686.1 hypothetical protein Pan54_44430 [Rubinisphaera italica]
MHRFGFVLGLLIFSVGCGGGSSFKGEKYPTAPVSGILKIDGKPFGPAVIEFVPVEKNDKLRIASGQVADDGSFKVGTYDKTDGVIPGSYKVEITVDITSSAKLPAVEEEKIKIEAAGNESLEINMTSSKGNAPADSLLSPDLSN